MRLAFGRFIGAALALLVLLPGWAFAAAIHIGNGAEPESLDIHHSSGVSEANIQRDLFEGLVTLGPDAGLLPGAAESWTVSDDGLTYTFVLRPGARWSNDEPVTAHDFVYAFRRGLAPETAADYAFILYPIQNAEAITRGEIDDMDELGVRAVDDLTLEITLKAPTPYFLDMLTHQMAFPLHQGSVEAHGDQWTKPGNMVSNGAYLLEDWVPQDRIKLGKNPAFHAADDVQIDTVYYYPTEDVGQELKRYRADELDITYDVPADQVAWLVDNLNDEFENFPYLGTYYYAINTTAAPFDGNQELRQALSLAIDRELLTEKITRAGEVPAYAFVPPGVMNYTHQTPDVAALSKEEREAKAKALYEQAGYSADNPLTVEILYNTSDNHKKIAIAVAAMWKQVLGVQATLRNEEWKVYLASRDEKNFEVARASWIGDYNDANTFLELFLSDAGPMNTTGFANPEFDELVRAAAFQPDLEERAAMLTQAENVLLDAAALIPIYHYTTQHMVKPHVGGWMNNVKDVHPTRYLWIDEES